MSANIMWRPKGEGKDLPGIGAPSNFIKALDLPRTFSARDYDFLKGVAAGNPSWEDAIREIFEAIDLHHEVEVFAVY